MMARYANLNCFLASLPGPNRETICLRPGETVSGTWWSRFPDLTKVPEDFVPSRDFVPQPPRHQRPVVSPTVVNDQGNFTACTGSCEVACQVTCEASCQVACESGQQTIRVFNHYEQIGEAFYCRYCDWSTPDEKKVPKHTKSYHADMLQAEKRSGPEEGSEDPGDQGAVDPSADAGGHTAPVQSSPPAGPTDEYWKFEDGFYICEKCSEIGVPWQTHDKGSMTRHAKRYHEYDPEVVEVG